MKRTLITNNEKETEELAAEFARELSSGDVVCLDGDLGAGKTVFTKGMCKALGVNEYVQSPTFTIVNEYNGNCFKINHFDMYRITDEDELFEIGFDEYICSDAISIIEWSDNIKDSLPKKRIEIKISKDYSLSENYRIIEIEVCSK